MMTMMMIMMMTMMMTLKMMKVKELVKGEWVVKVVDSETS